MNRKIVKSLVAYYIFGDFIEIKYSILCDGKPFKQFYENCIKYVYDIFYMGEEDVYDENINSLYRYILDIQERYFKLIKRVFNSSVQWPNELIAKNGSNITSIRAGYEACNKIDKVEHNLDYDKLVKNIDSENTKLDDDLIMEVHDSLLRSSIAFISLSDVFQYEKKKKYEGQPKSRIHLMQSETMNFLSHISKATCMRLQPDLKLAIDNIKKGIIHLDRGAFDMIKRAISTKFTVIGIHRFEPDKINKILELRKKEHNDLGISDIRELFREFKLINDSLNIPN